MVYVRKFSLPSEGQELGFLANNGESKRTCYASRYPFGLFLGRGTVPRLELELEPITILCGGNGSGKTTLLNLLGDKLELQRGAVFNRSSFFSDYVELCRAEVLQMCIRDRR